MIDPIHLLSCARDLIGDGGNPEYERALLEVVSDAIGVPSDDRHVVALLIGVAA